MSVYKNTSTVNDQIEGFEVRKLILVVRFDRSSFKVRDVVIFEFLIITYYFRPVFYKLKNVPKEVIDRTKKLKKMNKN